MPPDSENKGAAAGGVGLRRNGKQQACEPCRKGKMACDHGAPHCGRCTRRKLTSRCIYHPAPMTKSRPVDGVSILSSQDSVTRPYMSSTTLGRTSQNRIPQQVRPMTTDSSAVSSATTRDISPREVADVQTGQGHRSQEPHSYKRPFDWDKYATYQRSAKYYGPTSFNAVFNENFNLSSDLVIADDRRKHPANWLFGPPLLGRDRPSSQTVRMDQTVRALWNIPSKVICLKLLATYSLHHDTMNHTLIKYGIDTLWSTFGPELAEPRTSEKLSLIARVLFRSEERPLPPAPVDGMAWLDTFTGPNLRFEMLGILFSFFGMSYQTLQEWDELFRVLQNEGRDRKETTWRMKECADVCLKMCEISEENNVISIALQLCVGMLESVCIGDECFQTRRRFADAVACAVAAGLHRLPDYGPNLKPTAASEYKRRVFSCLYICDKEHAALNGIPPAVSSRFCIIRLPLDLSEEDLFLPIDQLALAISKLDSNGWNTSGAWFRNTFHRAVKIVSDVREDILEASLKIDAIVPPSRIDDLHRRSQESYDNLPPSIHYYAYGMTPKDTRGELLMYQAYLLLNVLQNKFLIDRLAIARGINNGQQLLNTALEGMEVTTMFWIKRDQLMSYSSSFDWIITNYGIPCAGVICVELLKQATGQSLLQFSRSDAIQKLTMFIGFLEWIRPTDGNYKLAGRLKKVVRRILDRVLEPPRGIMGNDMMEMPIDPMLAPFGEMDWLNTLDWTQGSWMEFN